MGANSDGFKLMAHLNPSFMSAYRIRAENCPVSDHLCP
jgi:hypothetical protein